MPFYDGDALYVHMNAEHYSCYVCTRAGVPHLYFNDAAELHRHFA